MNPDLNFLAEAYQLALQSKDPSTQNGVILMKDGAIIGRGYNRFPKGQYGGVEDTSERWNDRDLKLKHVVHAETAAILDAAREGHSTKGSTMYGCWVACMDCARDIIEAGIVELVGHHHPAMDARPDWNKGIEEAFALLREAGVLVRTVEGEIGATLRFAGKTITV
jgi:dCMP deaminase